MLLRVHTDIHCHCFNHKCKPASYLQRFTLLNHWRIWLMQTDTSNPIPTRKQATKNWLEALQRTVCMESPDANTVDAFSPNDTVNRRMLEN